jgi:hypothetical protein
MTQEKTHKVHPIVKEALDIAYVGVEPVEFDDEAIDELKHSLAQWFGHPDLFMAIVDLLNFAGILQKEKSPTAALRIVEVVCTAADALVELRNKGVLDKIPLI